MGSRPRRGPRETEAPEFSERQESMSSAIGDLVASLQMNVAPFQSAIGVANQSLVKFDNAMGGMMSNIMKPFDRMTDTLREVFQQLANLVNPVEWLAKGFNLLMYPLQWCARQFESIMDAGKAVDAFVKVEAATVRLGAAMKNAGDHVGATMAQLQAITRGRAGGLEGMATLVESGLGGSNLTGAFAAAKDLAAMMGSDLPSAANMLGHALEFPEHAARMLREAHVELTASQQEAIATLAQMGDKAGAQAIILAAVQEKTAGFADQMRGTLGGQMKEFSGIIEHISEIFGEALAPTMEAVTALFKDLATWVSDNKATILDWGAAAADAFKSVTEPLQTLIALLKAGDMASAFLFIQLQWEKFKGMVSDGVETLKASFHTFGEYLAAIWPPVWAAIKAGGVQAMAAIAEAMADALKGKVKDPFGVGSALGNGEDQSVAQARAWHAQHPEIGINEALANVPTASKPVGGANAEAIAAAQAAYDASHGAQGISTQAGMDLENKMAQDAAKADAKTAMQEAAQAAEQKALLHEMAENMNAPGLEEKTKPEKPEKEEHYTAASALEKGSAEAWKSIMDAMMGDKGELQAAQATADNTRQTNVLLQAVADKLPAEEGF